MRFTTRTEPAPWLYRVVVAILKTMVRALGWRVRIEGLEHLPETGPVIVVANHVSYLDPILLGLGVERRGRMVRYLAKRELFDHWFTGPVMRGADQILVDRRGDAGAALQHAELAMLDGKLLVIFPEATIHAVFDPAGGKTGSARLALSTGVPLIPAVAWGGQQIATKGGRYRPGWFSRHTVRFGAPISYTPSDDVVGLTKRIMDAIAALLEAVAADHPRDLGRPVVAP
jgi:1-acyl-sn-glycerol-3-phosphate acyltransferase